MNAGIKLAGRSMCMVIAVASVASIAVGQTNIAPLGTATANSFIPTLGPERLIDEILVAGGHEYASLTAANEFWSVALDQDYLIDSINVYPRHNFQSRIGDLSILLDGTPVFSYAGGAAGANWNATTVTTLSVGGIVGDEVRLELSGGPMGLSEVEVLGTALTSQPAAGTPEPSTFVLAVLGLVGLATTRRSRRRRG